MRVNWTGAWRAWEAPMKSSIKKKNLLLRTIVNKDICNLCTWNDKRMCLILRMRDNETFFSPIWRLKRQHHHWSFQHHMEFFTFNWSICRVDVSFSFFTTIEVYTNLVNRRGLRMLARCELGGIAFTYVSIIHWTERSLCTYIINVSYQINFNVNQFHVFFILS